VLADVHEDVDIKNKATRFADELTTLDEFLKEEASSKSLNPSPSRKRWHGRLPKRATIIRS
jgi:hypothetical protein